MKGASLSFTFPNFFGQPFWPIRVNLLPNFQTSFDKLGTLSFSPLHTKGFFFVIKRARNLKPRFTAIKTRGSKRGSDLRETAIISSDHIFPCPASAALIDFYIHSNLEGLIGGQAKLGGINR